MEEGLKVNIFGTHLPSMHVALGSIPSITHTHTAIYIHRRNSSKEVQCTKESHIASPTFSVKTYGFWETRKATIY